MKYSHLFLATTSVLLFSCSGNDAKNNTKDEMQVTSINVAFMDSTTRPQDDLFQFANGMWLKNNPVPSTESRWGSFNELDQANKKKLKAILEDAANAKADKGTTKQLVGDYYTSYMDSVARNKKGIAPIQGLIDEINTATDIVKIEAIIGKQHKNGIGSLFSFGVDQDLKDVNTHIVNVGQGGLGLPNKTYYFDEKKAPILAAYEKHIARMLNMAKIDQAESKASAIVALEKSLADASMAPVELRKPELTYNKFAKADFEKSCPNFNWSMYYATQNNISFDTIVVGQPKFMAKMNELLISTPIDTWKVYLIWNVINTYAGHLSDDFVQANFDFYRTTLSGVKTMKPRYERAISELTRLPIGEQLGKLFVEKYFSQKAKEKVNALVDNLTLAFRERIQSRKWMSDTTKKKAVEKLDAITRKLGFPEKWEDFSAIDIKADDYFGNFRNVQQYAINKNLNELHKPVDREEWGMPPHMVNAYYNPLLNEIAFPAGIMQPPFFDENAEDAVNYSRIGMVIGHELTHGFDDMGSKFAADGSFTDWWTRTDREAFETRTKIFGATYAKFCPFEGICVNPELTMGENIADLGGLMISYNAYKKTDEFKANKSVDGYTPTQRFILSYAQLWKTNYKDKELKKRIATDPHSPGKYRVNGPLKNFPVFYEAFDVKEGDGMYNAPDSIAHIW